MTDDIETEAAPAPKRSVPRQCGTCEWWKPSTHMYGVCWGFPPTPMPDGSSRRASMAEGEYCGTGWRPAERLLGGRDDRAG